MASSKSTILKNFSGKLGDQVVLKQYGDKTVLSKYPNFKNHVRTAKQLQNNMRMTAANEEAQAIMSDPEKRDAEQVRLNVTRNNLYNALIRDFFQRTKAEQTSA